MCAGHAPSLFNGHEYRSPSNHVSPERRHSKGRWRQPHLNGRQGQPQALKTGIRAPHPDEKAAVAQERVSKLEVALRAVGDDDNTAPNLREALKRARQQVVPLSTQDKVAQCESFLERAKKREAAARELVLEAQTELARLSAEVVEGEQRLATLRAELDAVDMSAEVQRLRALVEQLSKEKEGVCLQTDPNPKRVCRREDFVPQCDEEMQEWIQGQQRDLQAATVAGQLTEVARISQLLSTAEQE